MDRNRNFWESAARKVCLRVNIGHWLHAFLPALTILSLVTGGALVVARRQEWATDGVWFAFFSLLIPLALGAWFARRGAFYRLRDGLVWLEAQLRLHNRLTAAQAGVASWPEPRRLPGFFTWSWKRIMPLPVFAVLFLGLCLWIPVGETEAREALAPEEPLSWNQMESWIDTLEESGVVEEEDLESWREQLDSLRDQPAEEWYSHSGLEAGDSLQRNAEHAITELQQAIEKASYPMTAARDAMDEAPGSLNPLLEENWLEALSDLEEGSLRLSEDLLAELKEMDFSNLQTMDADQVDRLREMMQKGAEACGVCLGGDGDGNGNGDGDGDGNGEGAAALAQSGSGGIGKGAGPPTPLGFSEFPSLHQADRQESVSNPDLSRARLGDTLGVTETEPDSEPEAYGGLQAGGAVASPGEGGEAVWRSRLTPAEQEKLKRYFE